MLNDAPARSTPRSGEGASPRQATGQGSLFAPETPAARRRPAGEPLASAPVLGMRPARARLVNSSTPDVHDPELRPLAFLVVDCPFCEHQHIHPGGHVGEPRICLRISRCVGRPAASYYFPEVQR